MKEKRYEWMKEDTAAIMFASLLSDTQSRNFRLSVTLNDRIDPHVLRQAVSDMMPRFPGFCSRLTRGFFWAYLEHTDKMPEICEDTERPASIKRFGAAGGPDFRILYSKHSISIEAGHAIADGTGLMTFLNSVVARYLTLSGADTSECNGILHADEKPSDGELENAFERYYDGLKHKSIARSSAYSLPYKPQRGVLRLIFAVMDPDDIKKICKKLNVTVTEYFCSIIILSVIDSSSDKIRKPISIAVPVNLRKFFASETLRNFSGPVSIEFDPKGKRHIKLDDVIKGVRGQLAKKVTEENMHAFINSTYSLTANPAIKLIPGNIKRPGLRAIQRGVHRHNETISFSNLGYIKYDAPMSDHIRRFDFIGGDASFYGMPAFCTAASVNGKMSFCFSMSGASDALPDAFFEILDRQGIRYKREETSNAFPKENNFAKEHISTKGISTERIKAFFNM